MKLTRIAALDTPEKFASHLRAINAALEFDEKLESGRCSPLATPCRMPDFTVGNRLCVQPMEGWDAGFDGNPTELTLRRWRRFGESGAKLIWGGEAAAVLPEARANPRQLIIAETTLAGLSQLRETLEKAHAQRWGAGGLYIGLQLTHSGRFSRPRDNRRLEPQILYRHPLLDRKLKIPPAHPLLDDSEIEQIIEAYGRAARIAQRAGFQFVDIKHCHGYLGHEFLSAVEREGKYGGSFENRTRFLRETIAAVRAEAPGLGVAVRISAFDFIPFTTGPDGAGVPEQWPKDTPYPYAFGGDGSGTGIDLRETHQLLSILEMLGVRLVNVSAGSPYYVPHILRPATFPPSDGYGPPEDPLLGVARLVNAAAELKAGHPDMFIVGSGYSYLQEWLPHVAQHVVRNAKADFIGLGRMMLPYPDICADILEGRPLQHKRICRTISDCTTSARNGFFSGCYALDEFYRRMPEAALVRKLRT